MGKESGSFIWDSEKELANIHKHGIDFVTAAKAFKIPEGKFTSIPNIVKKKKGFSVSGKLKMRF